MSEQHCPQEYDSFSLRNVFDDRTRSKVIRKNKHVRSYCDSAFTIHNHLLPTQYSLNFETNSPKQELKQLLRYKNLRFRIYLTYRSNSKLIRKIPSTIFTRCDHITTNFVFFYNNENSGCIKRTYGHLKNLRRSDSTSNINLSGNSEKMAERTVRYLTLSAKEFVFTYQPGSSKGDDISILSFPRANISDFENCIIISNYAEKMKHILGYTPGFYTKRLCSLSTLSLLNMIKLRLRLKFDEYQLMVDPEKTPAKFWESLRVLKTLQKLRLEIKKYHGELKEFNELLSKNDNFKQLRSLDIEFDESESEWCEFLKNLHELPESMIKPNFQLNLKINLNFEYSQNIKRIVELLPRPLMSGIHLMFELLPSDFDDICKFVQISMVSNQQGFAIGSVSVHTPQYLEFQEKLFCLAPSITSLHIEQYAFAYDRNIEFFAEKLPEAAKSLSNLHKLTLKVCLSVAFTVFDTKFAKFMSAVSNQLHLRELKIVMKDDSIMLVQDELVESAFGEIVLTNQPIKTVVESIFRLKELVSLTLSVSGGRIGLNWIKDLISSLDQLPSFRRFTLKLNYLPLLGKMERIHLKKCLETEQMLRLQELEIFDRTKQKMSQGTLESDLVFVTDLLLNCDKACFNECHSLKLVFEKKREKVIRV